MNPDISTKPLKPSGPRFGKGGTRPVMSLECYDNSANCPRRSPARGSESKAVELVLSVSRNIPTATDATSVRESDSAQPLLASRKAESEVADANFETSPSPSDQAEPETEKEQEQRQEGEEEEEERIRVLIVEDELTIRRLLRRTLERRNVLVDEAADGAEGLRKMMEQQYDAVFSDLTMPVMDGFEMIKHFREWEEKSDRTTKQAVFAVSGSCLDEVSSCFAHCLGRPLGYSVSFCVDSFRPVFTLLQWRKQALQAGMDAFFCKPLNVEQALRQIPRRSIC